MGHETDVRLELVRPSDGRRIPARIEGGRLFSQCATVAPDVPVYVVFWEAGRHVAEQARERLRRCGHRNIVMEPTA